MTTPNYSDAERELQRVEESQNERPSLFKAASLLWVALDFQEGAPSRFELPKSVLDLAGRPQRLESAYRVFVEALGISESQPIPVEAPSPQWTRTPPSEPGTYWWRGPERWPLPREVEAVRVAHTDELGLAAFRWCKPIHVALEMLGGEWLPVHIKEPTA